MARKPGACKYEEKDYDVVYTLAETRIDSYSLGQLLKDLKNGKIQDDMSMQRDANQWSPKDKSMLMHTVFINLSILPISLIQKGTGGGVVKLLSDGKQRLSNFAQYASNEFPLSSATPHVKMKRVIKQPKLDENGKEIREIIDGKRRVIMEPCLDENGNIITEEVDYKVAGKYFSELPNALKDQFMSYKNMPQYVHINYSDEEIQMQMLRDNTSVKMTPAQIGAVLCGDDLAEWQKEFRDHDLFLNHSTWTETQEKKSLIERCITESFVLTMFDNAWNQNYLKNVETFKDNANREFLASFVDIVDDFDDIIKDFPQLTKKITKDNLHIILGVFRRFCDLPVRYKKDVFGKFLCDWFENIKDTTEYETQGNTGTKLKKTVMDKIAIMEEECKKYVEENGIKTSDNEKHTESTLEMKMFIDEHCKIDLPYGGETLALKSIMRFCDNFPVRDFKKENISRFANTIAPTEEAIDSCLYSSDVVCGWISQSNSYTKFSENDIAILVGLVHDYEDVHNSIMVNWMRSFVNSDHRELSGESGDILHKESVFKESINNFINKGE